MAEIKTEVLIVGSGPAGLTTAALLSRQGVSNLVVEKYSWLANTPRAHITNQRTMEIMRELGVEADIREKAMPQELMGNTVFCESLAGEEFGRLLTWGNHPARKADYELASPSAICDMPQDLLEPILLNTACKHGTLIRFKTEYLHHEEHGDGVRVTVRDRLSGETYTIFARYLIGADGANSAVVEQAGLPMQGRMGVAGSMNIEFEADLSAYVAHRPSVLYWIFQPGTEVGGIGAGLIRAVRPWNQWLSIYGYDIQTGPPDLTESQAIGIVRDMIGNPDIPVRLLRTSFWTVNHQVASIYNVGRVFCMGDAVHRHPPSNGLGSNTSIQDAYNLSWKLALVLKKKAAPSVLETYTVERQPVGRQIVDRANKSIEEYGPIFQALGIQESGSTARTTNRLDALKHPTVQSRARREALNKAIRAKSYEFNCLGVEMGQRYQSSAVLDDGTSEPPFERDPELFYHPTTWPGARIPHVWLLMNEDRVSTLDLVGRGRFALFTGISGAGWVEAAARVSAMLDVPIDVRQIGPGCQIEDTTGDWMMVREVSDSGCVLVRPDGHVAYRCASLPVAPVEYLNDAMLAILGLA